MDDAAYAFAQDVKDRKRTATGAYHKKSGSRSRKVTLSQDTLTHAQWKRRNGPVQTYDMNKPHKLSELRSWPRDMQRTYMSDLLAKFNPTGAQLMGMLECSEVSVYAYLKEFGLKKRGRPTISERQEFHDWMYPPVEETPAEPEATEPVPRSPSFVPITYDTITLGFTGTVTDLVQSILTGPLHLCGADTYSFTVTAVRKY